MIWYSDNKNNEKDNEKQPIDKDVNATEYFIEQDEDDADDWEDNPFKANDLEWCRTTEVGENAWDLR